MQYINSLHIVNTLNLAKYLQKDIEMSLLQTTVKL